MRTPVVIAGSGRSGTTWVLDSLAEANHMKTVFEPLHPVGVPEARSFACRYVVAGADVPELRNFMDRVFAGNTRNLWMNYRIRPDRFNPLRNSPITVYLHMKKSAQLLRTYGFKRGLSGQIVKLIRANLMLPWIVRQYRFPTVLIVRHPCAVIASRLRLSSADWGAEKALARYRDDKAVYALIGERFGVDLAAPMSTASALCCVWCIENVLPLEWAAQENYAVISYENLMMHPETEWRKVIGYLGLGNIPNQELLRAPSQQSALDMREQTFTSKHLERWQAQLDSDEIRKVADMLDRFGTDSYSVDKAMPAAPGLMAVSS